MKVSQREREREMLINFVRKILKFTCLEIEVKCKTLNDNEWVVVMFCTCVAVERHLY